MSFTERKCISERITGNPYVGRGIIGGRSADGKNAVFAYFIMGRSENSRNRVFTLKDGALFTEPYDASKVKDPSLIIYAAMRRYGNDIILTNGDQTDTVYEGLKEGKTFSASLETREFEPDRPNFTPRISLMMSMSDTPTYQMSILKAGDSEGTVCNRFTYSYTSLPGTGHFIHTYVTDGDPLPSFEGEPETVAVPDDINAFADEIWNSLDEANKISLFVMYKNIASGKEEIKIINKNQ